MIVPVVLSGGAGTRLWPVSRAGHPKPFMKLADGETLLRKTYLRALAVMGSGQEVLTVTNRDYYFMSKDEWSAVPASKTLSATFMLEPTGRNTAPAVAMAALHVAEKYGSDARLLVLAADHLIQDSLAFAAAVKQADALAMLGYLVTFGMLPTSPETGFGYIQTAEPLGGGLRVERFFEKPSLEKAKSYVAAGNFLWNSGMFCFKASAVLDELANYAPELLTACRTCWSEMEGRQAHGVENSILDIPEATFSQVPDISVDYALMERSDRVAVVPANFGWSDIGSWNAVRDLAYPDKDNNRSVGEVIFVDTKNTYVQSEDRLVATVGVDDLMVIDTPDALLIAHPDRAQDVKKVFAQLKSQGHEAYKLHKTVSRPWGTYTILEEGPRFKIKRIEVKPGASLSLQMHHHRSEHWIVVSGMAKVINGETEIMITTNQSTYIPAGHRHRLENPGVLDLVMIEVQSGEYLGEDDIVRFEDIYGRIQ